MWVIENSFYSWKGDSLFANGMYGIGQWKCTRFSGKGEERAREIMRDGTKTVEIYRRWLEELLQNHGGSDSDEGGHREAEEPEEADLAECSERDSFACRFGHSDEHNCSDSAMGRGDGDSELYADEDGEGRSDFDAKSGNWGHVDGHFVGEQFDCSVSKGHESHYHSEGTVSEKKLGVIASFGVSEGISRLIAEPDGEKRGNRVTGVIGSVGKGEHGGWDDLEGVEHLLGETIFRNIGPEVFVPRKFLDVFGDFWLTHVLDFVSFWKNMFILNTGWTKLTWCLSSFQSSLHLDSFLVIKSLGTGWEPVFEWED